MILTAWGACMRISEYSFTRAHLPDHNVRHGAVLPGKKGLSVEFYSDKVTKLHAAVKHRFIRWSFLPRGAKAMLNCYIALRPKAAKYFFVQMDGWLLKQRNIIDMLDACILQTKYRFLRILPHGLRSGGASQKRLDRSHILDICHDCHWSETGHAIDHYSRPNLIDLGPKTVFEERPRFRCQKSCQIHLSGPEYHRNSRRCDTSLFDTFTSSLSTNDGGNQK